MHGIKAAIRGILPVQVLRALEISYRGARGLFWQTIYGFPAQGARVIAVTGTNGKTTTCTYINEVLKSAGYKTAVLTTVFYEIDGRQEPNNTHYTISKQSIVQRFFRSARQAGVDWIILEVTSHALDQGRIMGVPVKIAAVTNLTQDHLDYHKDMESYATAKASLLWEYGAKHVILNADDKWFDYFKSRTPKNAEIFTIGTKPKVSGRIGKPKLTKSGGEATFATKTQQLKLKTNLIGEYNLWNAAFAAAVGSVFLMDKKVIERGISKVSRLEGRMDQISSTQNFMVYVDFAYTPDALEKTLSSLQKVTKGKVRIVFGATGDRDQGKRPKMGEVVAKHADAIYLTDDETYSEDPDQIRQAVYKGIKKAGGNSKTQQIADREEAIKRAISDAKKGDSILLAGIGHENSRNMGGKLIPWSEKEIAAKHLKRKTE